MSEIKISSLSGMCYFVRIFKTQRNLRVMRKFWGLSLTDPE